MDWKKINITAIMKLCKECEKQSITFDGEYAVIYSNKKEELKISYKKKEQ